MVTTPDELRETARAHELHDQAQRAALEWVAESLPDDAARLALARALSAGAELRIELRQPAWTAVVTFEHDGRRHRLLEIARDTGRVN